MLVATSTLDTTIPDPLVGTGCHLLVSFSGRSYLGMLPVEVGASPTWNLPLPEQLTSMTLHVQDWVLRPAQNQLFGSSRLTVPLAR